MNKVFISYHFGRQQAAKDKLVREIKERGSYLKIRNSSVETGDISDDFSDRQIFRIIREEYLKDSDVTVILLGQHTKCRKIVDWEIAASLSMFGSVSGRGQTNSLIVLLTDDFLQTMKEPIILDDTSNIKSSSDYYSSFITLENAGPRIFASVKDGYAVVDYFQNVMNNINRLNHLITEAEYLITETENNSDFTNIFTSILPLAKENKEKCPVLEDKEEHKFTISKEKSLIKRIFKIKDKLKKEFINDRDEFIFFLIKLQKVMRMD